jgi:S-adenosylmethionine uptake transporter
MIRAHPILPFAAAVTGIATFSAMDAVMKGASIEAGVYNALLLRCACGTLLMLPIWALSGARRPSAGALRVHLVRSVVVTGMALLFFWGLVRIPIAEAIALSFIAPLIALYLAAVLLGEQIQPKAVIASLLGLGGVLVIAAERIVSGTLDANTGWGIAAVLLSAMFYAWNLILQRQQAQLASPQEIALFQNLLVAAILALASPWLLVWPAAGALRGIVFAAFLAIVSLMLLSWGYARAEAQALVPVEYTGFIWAALFGWLIYGEVVTWATLLGVVLIVIGCWIAARKPTEMTAL